MATSTHTLRRIAWRSITAHKIRLALTILSVVLGTAFISGAFVFTASLDRAFKGVVTTAFDGVDVIALPDPTATRGINSEVEQQVADFAGVANLNITSSRSSVVLANAQGEPMQTSGAPSLGFVYYSPADTVGFHADITEGRAPERPGEVVINTNAARLGELNVGDRTRFATGLDQGEVEIVGIAETGADGTGILGVYFVEQQWRELFTEGNLVDQIYLSAEDNSAAGTAALRDELTQAFPDLKFERGEVLAEQTSAEISEALSFVSYFMVAFGVIGLLVGTFIISNTFTMLVAQRTKEFALLRVLGASRRQLSASVLFEALVVGIIGSALGVLAGLGLTKLLHLSMSAFGVELPVEGLTISTTAIVVPLAVGIAITMLAAWAPAARAGAIPPVEAMRSGDATSNSSLGVRTWLGAIAAAAAITLTMGALAWPGAETSQRAIAVGVAAVIAIVAFWLAGPALSIAVTGALGRMIGAPFGAVGKLAATNSQRNPRRTATTAFALTLGLMLVVIISMFGASMKAAVAEWTDSSIQADYLLTTPQGGSAPLPRGAVTQAAAVPEVAEVAQLSSSSYNVVTEQEAELLAAAQAQGFNLRPEFGNAFFMNSDLARWQDTAAVAGSLDLRAADAGVVVKQSLATSRGWNVGSTLLLVGEGTRAEIPITGIYADDAMPTVDYLIAEAQVAELDLDPLKLRPMMIYVDIVATDAEDIAAARSTLSQALADYLIVQVQTPEEFTNQAMQSIDTLLGIVYAMLALAVTISILGIINTLALSVVERTQEIGMLRAVGLQRGNIRMMIRLESLQIAIFGALVGIALGLGLGWALLTVLREQGITITVVPWDQISIMLISSALVGVIAAVLPGRRAAKTPPLAAIKED